MGEPGAETSVRLRVIDTLVELRLSGPGTASLDERVRRAWCRCVVEAPHGEPDVVVHIEHGADDDAAGLRHVMHRLSPLVTAAAAGHQAGRLVMLHAAGLADPRTGATVGLVAPSGAGKTTLCAVLGRSWGYVTDETLAVRADQTIAPYPKPLSLVAAGSSAKDQVCADRLGLLPTPARPRLAALVVLARDGSSEPWLEEVTTVRALARLSPESSYLARLERPLHRLAATVEAAGGLRVLHYAEAADLAPVLGGLAS